MIENISDIIKYPNFETFFIRFSNFVDTNYDSIINFYSGQSTYLDPEVITDLFDLIKETDYILERFEKNKNQISDNIDSWDVIEMIEEIKVKLDTIKNTPKWVRSSVDMGFSLSQVSSEFLKSNQTIESMVDSLNSQAQESDWADVSIYNNLSEIDYTYQGDRSLNVRVDFLIQSMPLNSVDIMRGDNILGKDLANETLFQDDDLLVLIPYDTVQQSADIILNTYKGSIPEFQSLGIDKNQVVNNVNSLQFPSIFRQISEMFRQDDSFISIELSNVESDKDTFSMPIIIIPRTGDPFTRTYRRVFDNSFDNTYN